MGTDRKASRNRPARAVDVFTDDERAAMKELVRERRRAGSAGSDGEAEVLAKIAEMPEPDRSMAERLHAIIKESAPSLSARTWYGMPAYSRGGQVICFFQGADRFKARYATFGFAPPAQLDAGDAWPTSFALKRLTPEVEAMIAALVKRAVN